MGENTGIRMLALLAGLVLMSATASASSFYMDYYNDGYSRGFSMGYDRYAGYGNYYDSGPYYAGSYYTNYYYAQPTVDAYAYYAPAYYGGAQYGYPAYYPSAAYAVPAAPFHTKTYNTYSYLDNSYAYAYPTTPATAYYAAYGAPYIVYR